MQPTIDAYAQRPSSHASSPENIATYMLLAFCLARGIDHYAAIVGFSDRSAQAAWSAGRALACEGYVSLYAAILLSEAGGGHLRVRRLMLRITAYMGLLLAVALSLCVMGGTSPWLTTVDAVQIGNDTCRHGLSRGLVSAFVTSTAAAAFAFASTHRLRLRLCLLACIAVLGLAAATGLAHLYQYSPNGRGTSLPLGIPQLPNVAVFCGLATVLALRCRGDAWATTIASPGPGSRAARHIMVTLSVAATLSGLLRVHLQRYDLLNLPQATAALVAFLLCVAIVTTLQQAKLINANYGAIVTQLNIHTDALENSGCGCRWSTKSVLFWQAFFVRIAEQFNLPLTGSVFAALPIHGPCDAGEWQVRRRDGRCVPITLALAVRHDDAGHTLGRVAIARDITEQKRSSRERDTFFSLTREMLCSCTLAGEFRRVNPAFCTTLGYAPGELVGKICTDFVHPDDVATTYALIQQSALRDTSVPIKVQKISDAAWARPKGARR